MPAESVEPTSVAMDVDWEAEDSDGWIAVGETTEPAAAVEIDGTNAHEAAVNGCNEKARTNDKSSKGTSICDNSPAADDDKDIVDLTGQPRQLNEKESRAAAGSRMAVLKVCKDGEIFRISLQHPASLRTIRKLTLNAVDLGDANTRLFYKNGQDKMPLPQSDEEPIADELRTLLDSPVIRIHVEQGTAANTSRADAKNFLSAPPGLITTQSSSQPSAITSSSSSAAIESPSTPTSVLAGPWWWLGGQFGNLLAGGRQDAALQAALVESAQLSRAVKASKAEARARLDKVLNLYGVKLKKIEADGNCQYRALAAQLLGDQSNHEAVRRRAVEKLKMHPERYSAYIHEPWEEYLLRMATDGQWGDNVSLQAACDTFGVEIRVFTDLPGAECVEIMPADPVDGTPQKPLLMAFTSEVHYDVAEPMTMAPGAMAQISENLTRLLKRRRLFE